MLNAANMSGNQCWKGDFKTVIRFDCEVTPFKT